MKETLKKITDNTIDELLQQEIILPSQYFQCFDKNSKLLEVDLEAESFNEDIQKVIANEFDDIHNYVNKTLGCISKVSCATKDMQTAIKNKDEDSLQKIYKQMQELENELEHITSKIFKDTLTKSYNRKWIYNKYLKNNETYKNDGVLCLIHISDYDYISRKYGTLICDSLTIFINNFLVKKLIEEGCNCKLARYVKGTFCLFLEDENYTNSTNIISNIKNLLADKTLKSKTGVLIKPSFSYVLSSFFENGKFQDNLEELHKAIKEQN